MSMSAQAADAGYTTRVEPTIRAVRAALPEVHREAFQAEIERTPLHLITKVLADWDVRSRALASPAIMAMAALIADEEAGRAERPAVLSDDEVRTLMPLLRQ
jgi:hypothetical protein